jgi:hypothetical protein
MRKKDCICGEPLSCLKIAFDTEGAFCPDCGRSVEPIGESKVEEEIWKSELCKSYINLLGQTSGEGYDLAINRLKENINRLAQILFK